jgi:hypothetical protein
MERENKSAVVESLYSNPSHFKSICNNLIKIIKLIEVTT